MLRAEAVIGAAQPTGSSNPQSEYEDGRGGGEGDEGDEKDESNPAEQTSANAKTGSTPATASALVTEAVVGGSGGGDGVDPVVHQTAPAAELEVAAAELPPEALGPAGGVEPNASGGGGDSNASRSSSAEATETAASGSGSTDLVVAVGGLQPQPTATGNLGLLVDALDYSDTSLSTPLLQALTKAGGDGSDSDPLSSPLSRSKVMMQQVRKKLAEIRAGDQQAGVNNGAVTLLAFFDGKWEPENNDGGDDKKGARVRYNLCSRCHQPKLRHICSMPEVPSGPEKYAAKKKAGKVATDQPW